eukprot:CAMPEP_0194768242 /NCGR_PEP_ID=MMETSP0323_2-20130528/38984_1 /TAXON_ID=2866 ORGANISM="Crypthecodinium cohnii, Strain Seligo" /NCGR_SAMPLE_ID=MMETSP0323_2 /ASSEMBLY_ACC=CAM_ASM_000346 /LENGTH=69 /DNA_ID=CAMNT_0039700537 /DNA_START=101 /DNA_END=307 /DNA_ORIENTATION=+
MSLRSSYLSLGLPGAPSAAAPISNILLEKSSEAPTKRPRQAAASRAIARNSASQDLWLTWSWHNFTETN